MPLPRWILVTGAMALLATPLPAQAAAGARDAQLRRTIQERFTLRVKRELGLTDQQASRIQAVTARYARQRADFDRRERGYRERLQAELRPGVAADQKTVAAALDGLADLQLDRAHAYQDEMRELAGFLSPVQRAQFLILRDRLMRRVQEVRDQRASQRNRSSPN